MIVIRPITAEQTRWLRHLILRPSQRPEELVYEGDDHPQALHVGAFDGDAHVGIATVCPQQDEHDPAPNAWRLRGMAVDPQLQAQGVGAKLLTACIGHAAQQGGALIWCTAREQVQGFYHRYGFVTTSDVFMMANVQHVRMRRAVYAGDKGLALTSS